MTIQACAALVERGDPDRFLACMAAPPTARAVLFPLFAFNLEVARAPWVTEEPLIAEMRLQWWRDVLEEAAGDGPVRAHEVAGPLTALIRGRGLPVDALDAGVAARRRDIYRDPFADADSLWAHLDATAGGLLWTAALALGAEAGLQPAVRQAARAGGLASWFMAVPALEARGRLPLPDGRPAAVRALARQGLADLAAARRARFGPAIPALRTLWRTRALLEQAAVDPAAVADGRLGGSEFARRGALLWKTITRTW